MVDNELELTYADLLERDLVERRITLTCVSNPVGGEYLGNATWLGVPMHELLAEAGVQDGADAVKSTQRRRLHRRHAAVGAAPTPSAAPWSPSG